MDATLRRSERLQRKRLRHPVTDENALTMGNTALGCKRVKRKPAGRAKTNAVSPREVEGGSAAAATPLGDISNPVSETAAAVATTGAACDDDGIPDATPGAPLLAKPPLSPTSTAAHAPPAPQAAASAKPVVPVKAVSVRDERNVEGLQEVVVVEQVVPTTAELRGETEADGASASSSGSSSSSSYALPTSAAERGALRSRMLADIGSGEWEVQHDAIVLCRRFALFAPAELAPSLAAVLPALCGAVANLRSATVRNAALALRELFDGGADARTLAALVGGPGAEGPEGMVAAAARCLLQRSVNADKKFIAAFAKQALAATLETSTGTTGAGTGCGDAKAMRVSMARAVLGEALRQAGGERAQASGMAAECALLLESCLGALGVGREAGAGVGVCWGDDGAANGADLGRLLRTLAGLVSGKVVGDGRAAAKKALRRIRKAIGAAPGGAFEAAVDATFASDDAAAQRTAALLKRESVAGARAKTARPGAGAGGGPLSVRERFAASQKNLKSPARKSSGGVSFGEGML
jgi:hypothetical protein